jgi:MarR family transcriptional regulator, lower aerobic nicotinate degradation pathway regulator
MLRNRPGFLLRRLHQIHIALFLEECGDEMVTPVQYSVLQALSSAGAADQSSLSRAVSLERTNVADVLRRLEARGFVRRVSFFNDRRMVLTEITPLGRALLKRVSAASDRAHARTIAALSPRDRASFLRTLQHLIDAANSGHA